MRSLQLSALSLNISHLLVFAAVGWNTHPFQEEDVWKVKIVINSGSGRSAQSPTKLVCFFFFLKIFVNVTEHKPQWLAELSGSSLAPGQLSTEGPAQEGRK